MVTAVVVVAAMAVAAGATDTDSGQVVFAARTVANGEAGLAVYAPPGSLSRAWDPRPHARLKCLGLSGVGRNRCDFHRGSRLRCAQLWDELH